MFMMEIPFMNLKHIAESGQVFRWEKIIDDPMKHKWKYLLFANDDCLLVSQTRQMFSFKCSEDEFWQKWYDYFDLSYEYDKAFFHVDKDDKCLKIAANKSSGIRILNQNLWEVLLCQVISEGVSFERAQYLIDLICRTFGEKKKSSIEGSPRTWYTFPTSEHIKKKIDDLFDMERELQSELVGNIITLCYDDADGAFSPEVLSEKFQEDPNFGIKNYLKSFDEISTRAANFIALCGYGQKDIIPAGKPMMELLRDEYNINSSRQFKELYEEIFDRYKGYRGLIGLYLNREAIKRKEETFYGFN